MVFVELKNWKATQRCQCACAGDRRALNEKFAGDSERRRCLRCNSAVGAGLGTSDGFVFRLEDRGGVGPDALKAAREQLFAQARSAIPTLHRALGRAGCAALELDIDRAKAYAMGVTFDEIPTSGRHVRLDYIDDFLPAAGCGA